MNEVMDISNGAMGIYYGVIIGVVASIFILGKLNVSSIIGVLIGATIGGFIGCLIGRRYDRREEQMEKDKLKKESMDGTVESGAVLQPAQKGH